MSENQENKASDSESFDDGIPAFLKIPQSERNAAAKKLAEEREAQKRSIAVRPDLIATPPNASPIIVPNQPVTAKIEMAPAPNSTKSKPAPKAVKTKATKAKAQPEKATDEAPKPSQAASVNDPTAGFPGSRLVAKQNTKHSNRKVSGRAQFPKIAALVTNQWVARDVICQHIGVVDNTTRCYLGQMGHTPEYATLICRPAPRKSGDKAKTEYRLVVA